jgi:hypothetical protein
MSLELLRLNLGVHLRFFARNRIVIVLAIMVTVIAALGLIPSILMGTSAGRFEIVKSIAGELSARSMLLTSPLGLLAVASHLRNRSVRVVLAKPCPLSIWLASIFLAGALIIGCVHLLIAILTATLSIVWGIPYQSGFVFTAIDGFCRSMIWFSYVTALGAAFHPVVAGLAALFLNEGLFYSLKFMIALGTSTAFSGLTVLGQVVDVLYYVLPMTAPFEAKTETIYSSLRVSSYEWGILLQAAGYTLLSVAFFFCLSSVLIRRKSML